MSDSEEDYMSDKFFENLDNKNDIRPGLVLNRTTKRQYELENIKKEMDEAKRPKNLRALEEELREKGLNTAISEENKGFKLLAKMGFKPGEGLGKTKSGITEPIKIEVKAGKSGVGTDAEINEKVRKMRRTRVNDMIKTMNEFKNANRMKQFQRFLYKDFLTAQTTCETLDSQKEIEDPVEDFYWTKHTIKKRRDIQEEEEDDFQEEFESFINDENLCEIIDYLRTRHLYCIFCAFVAEDENDLNTNCPGPFRTNHDDE